MVEYSKFSDLLKANGVSAYSVSKATHISQSVLSDWKTGKSTPKLDKLEKIADFFGVGISYFTDEQKNDDEIYYTNPETARVAQEIFENRDLRILFDAAQDAKPQDLQMAAEMLRRFKETNPDG